MDDDLVGQTICGVASILAYSAPSALRIWRTFCRFEIVASRTRRSMSISPSPPKLPDRDKACPVTEQFEPVNIVA
jgi:hypothetical protein